MRKYVLRFWIKQYYKISSSFFSKYTCPQVPWTFKRTDGTNLFCLAPCAICWRKEISRHQTSPVKLLAFTSSRDACNERHIFFPWLFFMAQRNLTESDFDHMLGNHFWTVSHMSHNQQNNTLNCNFCETLHYGNCFYYLNWMELITI